MTTAATKLHIAAARQVPTVRLTSVLCGRLVTEGELTPDPQELSCERCFAVAQKNPHELVTQNQTPVDTLFKNLEFALDRVERAREELAKARTRAADRRKAFPSRYC